MSGTEKAIRDGNLKFLENLATFQLFAAVPKVKEENRRYFADNDFRRNRKKTESQNMVEYWVPPEKTNNGANGGPTQKRNQIVPQGNGSAKKTSQTTSAGYYHHHNHKKTSTNNNGGGGSAGGSGGTMNGANSGGGVNTRSNKSKESRNEMSSKKSSADRPPTDYRILCWKMSAYYRKISVSINNFFHYIQLLRNRRKANKVVPIHEKVQSRHLELEPLCCLSSCLVRGGCTTVIVFEFFFIVITTLCLLEAFFRKKLTFWAPIPKTFNAWSDHHVFYYTIALYDILLFLVASASARALVNFDKNVMKIHFFFCFFSFFINFFFFIFAVWAIASPGPIRLNFFNFCLIFSFFYQLPLQIWAVTVVRSCRDFFALINVFVSLAEA